MRSEPKFKNWHPAWLIPGVRVWNDSNQWAGEFLGFEDEEYDGYEVGVFRPDGGECLVKTPMTFSFDKEDLFVFSKANREKRELAEADNYQI